MIDYTKPVETEGGYKAEVYSTNNGGESPVHGKIKLNDNFWIIASWRLSGESYYPPYSLIQKKEKITLWVNVYENSSASSGYATGALCNTEPLAIGCKNGDNYIGTYPITIEV